MRETPEPTLPAPLWVVIPYHRRQDLLRRAVEASAGWPVLVVNDSGAPLGWGGVEELRTPGGLGFARAVNLGLRWVEAKGAAWALLLNDDAAPEPGAIAALLAAVHPGLGAAGPVLVGPRGVESAGMRWSPRWARLRQRVDVPAAPSPQDALSGACLLVRSWARLDEGYPHGMEDVALCLALRAQGLELLLVPQARCWHEGGATLDRQSPDATERALRGHLRLVGPDPPRRALAVAYAAAQVLREGPRAARLAAVWRAWRAG